MRGFAPREEAEELVLEAEDDADAGVEAAEVGRHGGYGEAGAGGEVIGWKGEGWVGGGGGGGEHLGEEPRWEERG